jgi:hypothetical protein
VQKINYTLKSFASTIQTRICEDWYENIASFYTMIEVIFKIFLTDYIDFQGFTTKRIQKPLLIEYNNNDDINHLIGSFLKILV